jgi:hypothetical protein
VNLLDVTGNGEYLINLDHVRRIQMEAPEEPGKKAEIKFVFANGDENIFGISSGRLAMIAKSLHDKVTVA